MDFLRLEEFLLAAAIFIPLEKLVPLRRRQQTLRDLWATDLLHVLVSGLLIRLGLTGVVLSAVAASPLVVSPALREAIAAQPTWLAFLEILIIADLGFYLSHRALHAVPLLWRFHSVHHSIEEMDWLAAHRVHPVDQILVKTASLVPVFILGFPAAPILLFTLLYQWQALLIHSNVDIRFGPLRWLLASPQFHHWHHANEPGAIDKNFAGQLPLFDLLFGTLHLPGRETPRIYGTDAPVPRSYIGHLVFPFVWKGPGTALRTGHPSQEPGKAV